MTDIGVAVWIAVWVVVGVLVWHDIGAQAGLATDVIKVGGAVRQTGDALGVVGGLPLVGGQIGSFADRIKTMGAEVQSSGQDSRTATRRSRWSRGWPPASCRRPWSCCSTCRCGCAGGGTSRPSRRRCRAPRTTRRWTSTWRAGRMASLPWDELRAVTPDPCGAVERGDCRALADAELARLGLRRPA